MNTKALRTIAHQLHPVVTIVGEPSETVIAEVDRALTDHEIIKVRVSIDDRVARRTVGDLVASNTRSTVVQRIGKVVVLYRANPDANPRLSNIARYS